MPITVDVDGFDVSESGRGMGSGGWRNDRETGDDGCMVTECC